MPNITILISSNQNAALNHLANRSGKTKVELVEEVFGQTLRKSLTNAFKAEKSIISGLDEKGLTPVETTELLSSMSQAKEDYLVSIGK